MSRVVTGLVGGGGYHGGLGTAEPSPGVDVVVAADGSIPADQVAALGARPGTRLRVVAARPGGDRGSIAGRLAGWPDLAWDAFAAGSRLAAADGARL